MNILVIGCDQVGAALVRDLERIGHDISLIEKDLCRVSDPHLQVLYHKTYELDTICPTILTEQAVFRALAK